MGPGIGNAMMKKNVMPHVLGPIGQAHASLARGLFAFFVLTWFSFGRSDERLPMTAEVEGQLSHVLERLDVQSLQPGYGLCLFDVRGPLWSHEQGHADLEGRTPFSVDTRFRAGAISELFTAVRVLQLNEEGKMDLEAPIGRYAPSVFGRAAAQSTLGRIGRLKVGTILSHLSGTPVEYFMEYRNYLPLENISRFLGGTDWPFPPGAKYLHAGGLIDLVGLAIQEREGRPFEEGMQSALFGPLGMASSSFQYRDDPRNAAIQYRSGQQDEYLAQMADWNEVQVPSASLVSSLRDLVPFYSMVLGRGSWRGRFILSPESVSAMLSSKSDEVAQRQGIQVGYVWMLSLPELAHLGRVAWYSGRFIAHRNVVILAEDLGIGVAVATNSWNISDRHVIFPLAVEILKTYAGAALGTPPPAPAARQTVALPATLGRQIAGYYVSPFGIYRIRVEKGHLGVLSHGGEWRLRYCGENQFLPEEPAEIERMVFSPPGSLTAFLQNGMVISATRPSKTGHAVTWNSDLGTYRIANRSDYQKAHVYAFTLASRDGLLAIQGDDAREYWVRPSSGRIAEIVCNQASPFFGKPLVRKNREELLLGETLFVLHGLTSP